MNCPICDSSKYRNGKCPKCNYENKETSWMAKGEGQYLIADLGKVEEVSRISIKWYESDTRRMTYELQYSLDGKNFRRIGAAVSSGSKNNEYEDHDLERPLKTQFIKIIGFENDLNSYMSIVDLKVFGLEPAAVNEDTKAKINTGEVKENLRKPVNEIADPNNNAKVK